MAEFKLTINDQKNGKSYKKVLESEIFNNKKIGQTVNGDEIGFNGYEFEITGGSDKSGFPMRKDLDGEFRKKVFLTKGVGMQKTRKGLRLRKTVCGNMIGNNISQINLKVKKYGSKKVEDILGVKKEEKVEEKEIEPVKEVKEEKAKEVKEEKPVEEKKVEEKNVEPVKKVKEEEKVEEKEVEPVKEVK